MPIRVLAGTVPYGGCVEGHFLLRAIIRSGLAYNDKAWCSHAGTVHDISILRTCTTVVVINSTVPGTVATDSKQARKQPANKARRSSTMIKV